MTLRFLCIFALTLGAVLPAVSQQSPAEEPTAPARAEVLVLGVYHMSNPGHDIFNMQADDVLAPKRQAEIAQVIAVLKNFHPTKVAVEGEVGDDSIPKRYADYLAGKHELTRNEIEQIGFRLAKELTHKTVYPVDVEGDFPFPRIVNYAKANGRSKELDAMMGETGEKVKAQNAYLASHTPANRSDSGILEEEPSTSFSMQQTLEETESAILQLPEPARARLAKTLLLSLGEGEDSVVEELWAEEAEHRYREIESGEVTPLLSEDVLREARSRLQDRGTVTIPP